MDPARHAQGHSGSLADVAVPGTLKALVPICQLHLVLPRDTPRGMLHIGAPGTARPPRDAGLGMLAGHLPPLTEPRLLPMRNHGHGGQENHSPL